ncbi:MAG: Spy/CpxP family protein refolding chaperone [Candidatus Gastranaerophilales bacterium]|nr:Spy/CpxP family protein refolding chaperone [Candidatus Gastranaerophilales bacterium]
MKKLVLTLALCSLIAVTGCDKKQNGPSVPKSVSTYQQLNLTTEQSQKLSKIREEQRAKMDTIRKKMEDQRKALVSPEATKNLSEDKKQENFTKYREASQGMRDELAKQRAAYDEAFMGILDDNQKKIYQKYLNQREKEKQQRIKDFEKKAKANK